MPHYKLIYFNFYGRGETARILFHLADVPYEDVRVEVADWPQKKTRKKCFRSVLLALDRSGVITDLLTCSIV